MGYQVVLCAEKETEQLPADGTKIIPFQKRVTSMKNLQNFSILKSMLKNILRVYSITTVRKFE